MKLLDLNLIFNINHPKLGTISSNQLLKNIAWKIWPSLVTVHIHILDPQLKLRSMHYTGKEFHQQNQFAVFECLISQSMTTSMFTESLHEIM